MRGFALRVISRGEIGLTRTYFSPVDVLNHDLAEVIA
jgi:hypothetical protein